LSVGSKLALLIFGLYTIVSFFIIWIGVYLYFNIEIEATFLMTLFSGILLGSFATTSVIWRTLRESLDKTLNHLHKSFLFDFYRRLGHDTHLFRISPNEIENARDHLKRYGKFLGAIRLHPIELKRMDEFIFLLEHFEKNIQKICNLAKKEIEGSRASVNREKILKNLGFEPLYPSQRDEEEDKEHSRVALKLQGEQPKLVDNTKRLLEDLKEKRKEIYRDLDNFMKTNNLAIS